MTDNKQIEITEYLIEISDYDSDIESETDELSISTVEEYTDPNRGIVKVYTIRKPKPEPKFDI